MSGTKEAKTTTDSKKKKKSCLTSALVSEDSTERTSISSRDPVVTVTGSHTLEMILLTFVVAVAECDTRLKTLVQDLETHVYLELPHYRGRCIRFILV